MLNRHLLLFLAPLCSPALLAWQNPSQGGSKPAIHNPYFEKTSWKVWRDDASPVKGVTSMERKGKDKVPVQIDLSSPPMEKRIYPVLPKSAGDPLVQYQVSKTPSQEFAGIWDDVYSSWSGLHGYVRTSWRGVDKSKVAIRDQIIHFVDARKREMTRCGVNFIHQSTTGMAHSITNGYSLGMTKTYERLYFADLLVCSPAHATFGDQGAAQSTDLYIAHSPTLFNSLGSSNSETMAITKMILAGGYLPPKTKRLLKRNGLYPAAMLYVWKAAMPYDVPYDHELKHRVCYKSVGDRKLYPENYSAAGIERGDLSLPFHQYDDLEHMRRMIAITRSMDVALPEACFEILEVEGGSQRYALYKAATIIQEKDEEVTIRVSTKRSYYIQGLPLTLRWKLLYGNKKLRLEATEKEGEFLVTVPWDDALPEGRTVLALTANNGRFDSNPALLTIYRKIGKIPPNGQGYSDYRFDIKAGNRRPVLLGLQDQYVRPGKTIEIPLHAIDPEGFSVSFYKRAGEVGEIQGNVFTWKCPRKEPAGSKTVTILGSDGTSGNSYAGKQIQIHIGKPSLLAQISADKLTGKAPLRVHFSAKKSLAPRGKTKYSWLVTTPALGRKAKPKKKKKAKAKPKQKPRTGKDLKHVFDKPGLYEVTLTVQNGKDADTEMLQILVTKDKASLRPAGLCVEGNGVQIANKDKTPSLFDHTDFGSLDGQPSMTRQFVLINSGDKLLRLDKKKRIVLEGEQAKSFKIIERPESRLGSRESSQFVIRFRPKGSGPQDATVLIRAGTKTFRFQIRGSK